MLEFKSAINHSGLRFTFFALMLTLLTSSCASNSDLRETRLLLSDARTRLAAIEEQNQSLQSTNTNSFGGVRAAMIELNKRTESAQKSMAATREDFAKMQSSVEDALSRTKSQLEDIHALRQDMQTSERAIQDYEERFQKTQQSLADFQLEYARHLRDLEKRFEEMEVTLQALQSQLADSGNTN